MIAMQRKHTMLWMSAVAATALLIGYFALQSGADVAVGHDPRDKANHHPKHVE